MGTSWVNPAGVACMMLWASAATGATPSPGYYYNLHYVVSASVSGAGQCTDAQGTYFNSSTYYPGPSKKGFIDYRPLSSQNVLAEVISTFPQTQPAGVAQWSGNYTITVQPGGTVTKGTFDTTTTYADAHSSVSSGTFTYPVAGGGTCTTVVQSNFLPQTK